MRIDASSTANTLYSAPARPAEPPAQAPAAASSVVRISDRARSGANPGDALSDPSALTRARDLLYFDLVLRPNAEARLHEAGSSAPAGSGRQDWAAYVGRLQQLIDADGERAGNDTRLSAELSALLARFSSV